MHTRNSGDVSLCPFPPLLSRAVLLIACTGVASRKDDNEPLSFPPSPSMPTHSQSSHQHTTSHARRAGLGRPHAPLSHTNAGRVPVHAVPSHLVALAFIAAHCGVMDAIPVAA